VTSSASRTIEHESLFTIQFWHALEEHVKSRCAIEGCRGQSRILALQQSLPASGVGTKPPHRPGGVEA
jgi:hypothetical protein